MLLGVQVPEAEREEFRAALRALGGDYTFNEISGRARQVFKMFLS